MSAASSVCSSTDSARSAPPAADRRVAPRPRPGGPPFRARSSSRGFRGAAEPPAAALPRRRPDPHAQRPSQVCVGDAGERPMTGGVARARPPRTASGLPRALPDPTADLADVVVRHRDADDVADPLEQRAAPVVHVERLVPVALVVGLDAEVVERGRLTPQVAELSKSGNARPRNCTRVLSPASLPTWRYR